MAGILQNFLGGGTKPETQGRKATAVGDRDAGSRDTVARKPAAKAASPKHKVSSGEGSKPKSGGGGGGGALPQTVPVPPMRSQPGPFPPRPEGGPPPMPLPDTAPIPQANPLMPQMPPRPEGPVGDNTGQNPGPFMGRPDAPVNPMPFGGGPYPPRPEGPAQPQPFAGGPVMSRPQPPVPSMTPSLPGPGRAELAGLLNGGPQQQGQMPWWQRALRGEL